MRLDTILLKTASRCNFDCTYCYVYRGPDSTWRDQPKRMPAHVLTAILHRLTEYAALQDVGFAIVLHGGEPLLLGCRHLSDLLRGLRACLPAEDYPFSIQTNGSLLSDSLLDLFSETRTSVSVSIDGPPEVNDIARQDPRGRSTFASTLHGIQLLSSHHDSRFLFAGTLSVIQPASDPKTVYDFFKELRTPSMDFLLQDGNHDRLPPGKASFSSTEYGNWLVQLLDLYLSDPAPVPVRVFDDLIKLCLGGRSIKEGLGESQHGILIVESDGEIRKNDTLRTSFEGSDQFSPRWNIVDTPLRQVLSSKEFLTYSKLQQPTCPSCQSCDLLPVCGGGMPLYRWSRGNGYDNPSVYCLDHAEVIRNALAWLKDMGMDRLPASARALADVS